MLQPENQSKKYQHLFTSIDSGEYKIPKFQRDFVWSKKQTASLIDSIIKGFPIGTFILWKTKEELRSVKNIGNIDLPEPKKEDYVYFVLDGQQRITSLYALQKGAIFTHDGSTIDYNDICIDLSCDPEETEQVVLTETPKDDIPYISVFKLLNGDAIDFIEDFPDKGIIKKISSYKNRLTGYDFSTIVISEYPIDIACDVFTRINTGGTELTLFEIMVAKTYDQDVKFDLADEYEKLIDNNGSEKDLKDAGFETITASIVLQTISAILIKRIRRKDILTLNKSEVIEKWSSIKDSIFTAVDYIRTQLRIPVSRILPYNALLIPFTYFFYNNKNNTPSPDQTKFLVQYFWWASLSHRFSSGVEGKVALDLGRIDDILDGKQPGYRGEEIKLKVDDIKFRWFSVGDAFCKAILSLFAYHEPKSFLTNSIVKIDNSWLKIAASKNYHHFFPKSYLAKQGYEHWQANSIINITIVDDYLNKKKIGSKAPSLYMNDFKLSNSEIDNTMKSHLIDDLDDFGVMEDEYETFIQKRSERILEEIKKRLDV